MSIKNRLQWHADSNNESLRIRFTGALTRNTLLPFWEQRVSFLSPKLNQHIYWDLRSLTKIDSAGFALLCDLLHHYQQHNKNWLINPPETVKTLSELFGLQSWIADYLICEKN